MSIPGKIKEFIESCPFLEEFEQATFSVVNVDLLEEEVCFFSLFQGAVWSFRESCNIGIL